MIWQTKLLTVFAFILLWSACKKDTPPGEVLYTVTFSGTWTSQDHPTDYPSNAHFSKAVGWSHEVGATFFELGQLATEGVKVMAETGDPSPLDEEIQALIDAGKGLDLIIGAQLSAGDESATFEIGVSEDFPLVTLVSMIAPSPDWFVAVENVALKAGDEWLDNLVVDATVYDAGTDSGESFKSANTATNPAGTINLLTVPPLGNGSTVDPPVARFSFERKK